MMVRQDHWGCMLVNLQISREHQIIYCWIVSGKVQEKMDAVCPSIPLQLGLKRKWDDFPNTYQCVRGGSALLARDVTYDSIAQLF